MIDWRALGMQLADLARDARPGGLLTLTVPLPHPRPHPLADLSAAGEWFDWFHWRRPDTGLALTGLGAAVRVDTDGPARFAALGATLRGLRQDWRHAADDPLAPPPLAFCGFAFAPAGGAPLPNACLVVPAVLLRECAGQASAAFTCAAADAPQAIERWRTLLARHATAGGGATPAPPARLGRQPAPLADLAFLARGGAALSAIESGRFAKLVLTRGVRLSADRPLAPAPVVEALAERNPDCAVWAVGHGRHVFLGASPERLLAYRGGRAEVDALAGTAWTTLSGDGPASLSLADDKNRREHELVVASVREALAPLCESLAVPRHAEVMRIGELQHLRRRIVGETRPEVTAFDLIARLHPTPAVGGTPTATALDWLAAHGDRRGAWYTGGIGWLDADGDADFAVALRCGLLAGTEATLYAGAGFVAGSDPRQELAETEAKLSPMLAALRAGARRQRAARTPAHRHMNADT